MHQLSRTRGTQFSSAGHVVAQVVAAAVAAIVLLAGAVGFAPVVGAQSCTGSVSTSVTAASLPGGSWSVDGGCLASDSFFEYSNTEGRAQVAVSSVTCRWACRPSSSWDAGHGGRNGFEHRRGRGLGNGPCEMVGGIRHSGASRRSDNGCRLGNHGVPPRER